MARLLLPLALGAAAFAAAWLAGRLPPGASAPVSAAASPAGEKSTAPAPAEPARGLAWREAQLRRLEAPSLADIRRLLDGGRMSSEDLLRLITAHAKRDPAGLWAWYDGGGRERLKLQGFSVIPNVFPAWFRKDPDAAIAAWRAVSPGEKHQVSSALLSLLAGEDAAARAGLLPYLDELAATGGRMLYHPGEVQATAAALLALPPGAGRDRLLQDTALAWMDSDWKAATSWAASVPPPLQSKILADLVATALNRNVRIHYDTSRATASHAEPECMEWARHWITTEADPEARRKLGAKYVESLAATDPGAALAWAQENLAARPLTKAVAAVLARQAGKDPAAARAMVEQLPPGGVKQTAAFGLVGNPTPESVTWLVGQTEKEGGTAWYGVAANWAFTEPDAYKKYLESAPSGSLPEGLVTGGFHNLLNKDAPGTLDWALRTQTATAAGEALEQWTHEDAPAAAAWFKAHTDAAWRPEPVNGLADRYFRHSPSEAVDWAAALPAGPNRETAVNALRKSLSGNNPLPPDQRAALEARLPKR